MGFAIEANAGMTKYGHFTHELKFIATEKAKYQFITHHEF